MKIEITIPRNNIKEMFLIIVQLLNVPFIFKDWGWLLNTYFLQYYSGMAKGVAPKYIRQKVKPLLNYILYLHI